MNELALFAGAGGGLLGTESIGLQTICAVELEWHCRCVLLARQNNGELRSVFPIWDDIRSFDGRPWRGRIDIVSGGFPCQAFSTAARGAATRAAARAIELAARASEDPDALEHDIKNYTLGLIRSYDD